MIYLLCPDNIKDEQSVNDQLLYIHTPYDQNADSKQASQLTAAFQLCLQITGKNLEQINFKDSVVYFSQYQSFLIATTSFPMASAIKNFLSLYLPNSNFESISEAKSLIGSLLRPFIDKLQQNEQLLSAFSMKCAVGDFSSAAAMRAFYTICSLPALQGRQAILTIQNNIICDNNSDHNFIFSVFAEINLFEFFTNKNINACQYSVDTAVIWVSGAEIPNFTAEIANLNLKIPLNLTKSHQKIISSEFCSLLGQVTPDELFIYNAMKGKFQKMLYKGIEMEDRLNEVRFK